MTSGRAYGSTVNSNAVNMVYISVYIQPINIRGLSNEVCNQMAFISSSLAAPGTEVKRVLEMGIPLLREADCQCLPSLPAAFDSLQENGIVPYNLSRRGDEREGMTNEEATRFNYSLQTICSNIPSLFCRRMARISLAYRRFASIVRTDMRLTSHSNQLTSVICSETQTAIQTI